MRKLFLLIPLLFLAACSTREVHTQIYTNNTTIAAVDIMPAECTQDSDCVLHDSNYGWGCCWSGRCDAIDYSQDRWIAVNNQWLSQEKDKYCPSDCGPGPACPTKTVNMNYTAKCISHTCEKVAQ